MGSDMFLRDIFSKNSLGQLQDYKLHCAITNKNLVNPLNLFLSDNLDDQNDWLRWNRYRSNLNRKYIFSMIRMENKDSWLFSGVYEIIAKNSDYKDVLKVLEFSKFEKRLKLNFTLPSKNVYLRFEKWFDQIKVEEILKSDFILKKFEGYENVDLSYLDLRIIVKNNIESWHSLKYVNGVYLIRDTLEDKFYVGSCYGENGFWGRFSNYSDSFHGGNLFLKNFNYDYAIKNFRYSILEIINKNQDANYVIRRENFWKNILNTKKGGYNLN